MRTNSRRTIRGAWRTVAVAGVALLTSGCILATEVDITIAGDGSGTSQSLIQYDDDMARLLGPASQFRDEVLDARADGADVSIVPAAQLDDPFTQGLRYRASFDDADGLRDVLLDGPFDRATVRLVDGTLTIDASFDGTDLDGDDMFAGMAPTATARVTIDLQGDVVASNADRVSGSTLVWEFDISRDGRLTLTAELGGGGLPVGLIVGVLAVLAVAGGGFVVARGRGKGPGGDAAPGGEPAAGPGTTPGPAPTAG